MPLKSTWQNGEQFNASDANDVATEVNGKYVKPAGGIPITDFTSAVQVSLGKADSAVQAVSATSITDSTATGRSLLTAADASAARTTLGVAYGTTAGTVAQGNDARLTPSSTSITDSTATGRALLTAADAPAARTAIGVAYGTAAGTVAQGNDSRITGAEQAANKGVANGYASLDSGGKVPVAQLPNSIMEYQGTYNASTNSPSLSNGTGNAGDVYRVSVAGSRNFGAGAISLDVGDYVIYSGSVWESVGSGDAVSSVAGRTGDVTLTKTDVGLGNVDNTSDATKNSATATLTNKTLTNPTVNNYTEGVVAVGTVTSSSTLSLTNGTVLTATLTASTACAFTMPAVGAGKSFVLLLRQAATTGNGSATFTNVKWPTSGAPTITAAAGKMDILSFVSDGTNWYGSAAQGFTP